MNGKMSVFFSPNSADFVISRCCTRIDNGTSNDVLITRWE